jgi:hypothetical protein
MGRINTLIIFFSCLILTSCHPAPGLVRTNFEHFRTKKFSSLGFSLDLPIQEDDSKGKYFEKIYDSDLFKKNSKTLGDLSLAFHPIFGSHPLSEPVYLIDFSVSRLSKNQFDLFQNQKHYLLNDPCYREISPALSESIVEKYTFDSLNRREYECRYKTIILANGDVLVCLGRILLEDQSNFESDIQQLRGIMNSITILKSSQ